MHLLGHYLPDHKPVRIALRAFYGLSHERAARLLARLSIPEKALVSSLTEPQVTALSGYLSAPLAAGSAPKTPVVNPDGQVSPPSHRLQPDPLDTLKIETDLRRQLQANIQHHRIVGTYKGRRHAMGLPVRGQNTRNNSMTARRLNSLNRRRYTTAPPEIIAETAVPQPPSQILRILGMQ